ncbi:hypothetical protein ACQB6R_00035 [Propionibacteriaceae bacterium G1746]
MKVTPMTAVLVIVSVLVAGLLGQFRDTATADFEKKATLGEPLDLDNGQLITVLQLSYGQYAVDGVRKSTITPERFVAVHLRFATPRERENSGVRCFLRTSGGGIIERAEDDNLRFPDPGFVSTGTVIFEVNRTTLTGASLSCVPTSVIVFREPELTMPLGVTAATIDQVWDESALARVDWPESTLEVYKP